MYMCFAWIFFSHKTDKRITKFINIVPKHFFLHLFFSALALSWFLDVSSNLVDVAAGAWVLYKEGQRSHLLLIKLSGGLVDVRSILRNMWDQVGVRRRRRRRRVGVYDRPAAHKSIPDWLKQKKTLLWSLMSGSVTGRLASDLQVRWWCCIEDTTFLLPKEKINHNFIKHDPVILLHCHVCTNPGLQLVTISSFIHLYEYLD